MKKDGLLILTVILCAAAAVLMAGAIAVQKSNSGNTAQESIIQEPAAAQSDGKEPDPAQSESVTEEASTVPSVSEGAVRACFLTTSEYESMLSGKERYDFEPSELVFEGQNIPYDKVNNTAYIPQSILDPEWKGTFKTAEADRQICILNDEPDEKQVCIEEGRVLRLAVVVIICKT